MGEPRVENLKRFEYLIRETVLAFSKLTVDV